MFSYFRDDSIFWFRIFGWGIHFKDTTQLELLFSERTGLVWTTRIGKWQIKFLKPLLLDKNIPIDLKDEYRKADLRLNQDDFKSTES